MTENEPKKVVIALSDYLKSKPELKQTKYSICKKYGMGNRTVSHWENQAPEVVEMLFRIVKEQPKTNILKALKDWQKPPYSLVFLRDFMTDFKVDFTELVKEQ